MKIDTKAIGKMAELICKTNQDHKEKMDSFESTCSLIFYRKVIEAVEKEFGVKEGPFVQIHLRSRFCIWLCNYNPTRVIDISGFAKPLYAEFDEKCRTIETERDKERDRYQAALNSMIVELGFNLIGDVDLTSSKNGSGNFRNYYVTRNHYCVFTTRDGVKHSILYESNTQQIRSSIELVPGPL